MTVHSMLTPLEDAAALVEAAKAAGISPAQAKRFAARLADMPVERALRICATAHADEERQRERMARMKR